ncbi:MAG: double zinc ribbon domain-containing protein [Oscillospiraceae bacterium]|nr:double zinc ribbon domain-containing protein [Oscillospiraceae bacterium]
MKSKTNTVSRFLLDLAFPNRCPCCDGFIKWDMLVCGKCHRSVVPVYDKVCRKCGKEICICAEELFYDMAAVPLRYEGPVREGILSLKRGNNKNFGIYTGRMLAEIIKNDFRSCRFDCVVPVPMSAYSLRKRGYNQAEVIASEISESLGIPVVSGILFKNNTQSSQHYLKRTERMKNITAIKINKTSLNGMNIILCDDVITTGSTVNRCAQLLKSSGCGSILLAAAAQSKLK